MVAVYTIGGEQENLRVQTEEVDPWQWHLFQNDVIVDKDTILSDLVEADYSGYATVASVWDVIAVDAFERAYRDGFPVEWECDGLGASNVIYGYYVTDADGLVLLWAERLPAPKTMALAGDTFSLIPRVLMGDLAPP